VAVLGTTAAGSEPQPPIRFNRQSFTVSWPAAETPAGVPLFGQLKSGQLAATAGWAGPPVRFSGPGPVSPEAAQTWKASYAYVRDTVLASPATRAHALIVSSAAQLLAATTLATFPNTTSNGPAPTGRPDAHPDTLQRALAFIDENARYDTSVADIAAAADVTVRAVQQAYGITPSRTLYQK
jgi:hypothetical protein